MQQDTGPGEVLQKPYAEPGALGRALDETRDVRHHETAVRADAHHPETRVQRGKRVIADLRSRGGHRADERALPGVRQPKESHVRDQPQFKAQQPLLARQAGGRLARCAVGARFEALVTPAALATLGDFEDVARDHQVAEEFIGLGVDDRGAGRHVDVQVLAATAGAFVAAAGLARFRFEEPLHAKIGERVDALACAQVHVPALATVAAVGSAERNEFLAAKAQAAAAPVAGRDPHHRFIDEFHAALPAKADCPCRKDKKPRSEPGFLCTVDPDTGQAWAGSATTLTKVRCAAPFFWNSTLPATSAKSVWSVPTPTFWPGL